MQAKPIGGARRTAIYFVTIVMTLFIPFNSIWAAAPPLTDGTIRDAKVRPLKVYIDAKLKTRIENALATDPIVESYEISVTVRNGVVDLFGSVGTVFEKLQAEDLATRVNGVIAVNNYLVVSTYSAPYAFDPFAYHGPYTHDFALFHGSSGTRIKTDARIEEDIQDEFFWSPFVNGEDVQVRVEEGKATLTGTVGSLREFNAATENAYDGGAAVVNNRLIVQ